MSQIKNIQPIWRIHYRIKQFLMSALLVCLSALLVSTLLTKSVAANEPAPIKATITSQGSGYFTISVTVQHEDEGDHHYATRWEVLDPANKIIARRVLMHPHVEEQPFTRSLSAVRIKPGVNEITIKVYDSKHGYGRRKIMLEVPHQG